MSASKVILPSVPDNMESKTPGQHASTSDTSRLIQSTADETRPDSRTQEAMTNEELLRRNTSHITPARQRLGYGRRDKFYFLTIPGLIRIVEVFFSLLHVTMYGFYCTFYEKELPTIVSPFFLATTREQFFLMANFHSFMGGIVMVISGIFSSKSNSALISSLYPFVFDLVQFVLIASASISLILLYRVKEVQEKMVVGLNAKHATSFTGAFLSICHLVSSIYDLVVFIRRWRKVPDEDQ